MPVYKTIITNTREWMNTIRAGSHQEAMEIARNIRNESPPDSDLDDAESCELPEDYKGKIDNEN